MEEIKEVGVVYTLSWCLGVEFNIMRLLSEEEVVLDSNNVWRAFLISKRHEFCDRYSLSPLLFVIAIEALHHV